MKAILTHAGYDVFQAGNGLEALEMTDRQHIDLILLDVAMPKMDGYAFTERLRPVAIIRLYSWSPPNSFLQTNAKVFLPAPMTTW